MLVYRHLMHNMKQCRRVNYQREIISGFIIILKCCYSCHCHALSLANSCLLNLSQMHLLFIIFIAILPTYRLLSLMMMWILPTIVVIAFMTTLTLVNNYWVTLKKKEFRAFSWFQTWMGKWDVSGRYQEIWCERIIKSNEPCLNNQSNHHLIRLMLLHYIHHPSIHSLGILQCILIVYIIS